MPKKRKSEEQRKKENTEARRIAREDNERREREQRENTRAHRQVRADNERREREQRENTRARRQVRENKERREQEQRADTDARRQVRDNEVRKKNEQRSNTKARKISREDDNVRTPERARDSQSRKDARNDPVKRRLWQDKDTEAHVGKIKKNRSNYDWLYSQYEQKIKEAPVFICSCCGGLWYKTSTSVITKEILKERGCTSAFIKTVLQVQQDEHRLCATCKKSIKSKNVPRLCLSNGFAFPNIPSVLNVTYLIYTHCLYVLSNSCVIFLFVESFPAGRTTCGIKTAIYADKGCWSGPSIITSWQCRQR
jgi:hypothetical protein